MVTGKGGKGGPAGRGGRPGAGAGRGGARFQNNRRPELKGSSRKNGAESKPKPENKSTGGAAPGKHGKHAKKKAKKLLKKKHVSTNNRNPTKFKKIVK
jgi:hypothetical protein